MQRRLEVRQAADREKVRAIEVHFNAFLGIKEAAYKLVHRRPSVAATSGAALCAALSCACS